VIGVQGVWDALPLAARAWARTAASAGGAAGTSSVRLQYRYDRAGNALSRRDLVDAALSELYQYDPLDRLTSFQRGVPSAAPTLQGKPGVRSDFRLRTDYDALGRAFRLTTYNAAAGERKTGVSSRFRLSP